MTEINFDSGTLVCNGVKVGELKNIKLEFLIYDEWKETNIRADIWMMMLQKVEHETEINIRFRSSFDIKRALERNEHKIRQAMERAINEQINLYKN